MNRKIIMGVLSIFAVLAVTAGVTYALFSAQATNAGNTFGAGTLVLAINGAGGSSSTPVFTVPAASPGDTFDQKLTLSNTGTVNASSVAVNNIALGGANTELGDKLTLLFFNDVDDSGTFNGGDVSLGSGHLTDPTWAGYTLPGVTLPASGSFNLAARITFDSDADNSYQGKSLSFNLTFQANQ